MAKCTEKEFKLSRTILFEGWGFYDGEELKMQGEMLRKKNFKYLGSTVSSDGRCEEEVGEGSKLVG